MVKNIISDWKPEYAETFGEKQLLLHHRLCETGLFTKEALARLIDRHPDIPYNLSTMGYDPKIPNGEKAPYLDTTARM